MKAKTLTVKLDHDRFSRANELESLGLGLPVVLIADREDPTVPEGTIVVVIGQTQ